MEEKIILAVIGIAGGAIGSLVAPWASWGIEKRKQKLTYRRELIASWRKMIVEVAEHQRYLIRRNNSPDIEFSSEGDYFWQTLESKTEWHSLRPHLNMATLIKINQTVDEVHGHEVESIIQEIIDEITQLEKKWGLV